MDELRRKINRFREAQHPPGSALMIELLEAILEAFHDIKNAELWQDRRATIDLLYEVQGWEKALEREDFDVLSRSVALYGVFAL